MLLWNLIYLFSGHPPVGRRGGGATRPSRGRRLVEVVEPQQPPPLDVAVRWGLQLLHELGDLLKPLLKENFN